MKMGRWIVFVLLLCIVVPTTFAESARAVRKRVEGSMLVTGKIEVDSQGRVVGYALDQQDKLPPAVTELMAKSVPEWRFEPVLVEGRAARVKTDMSVRVVARRADAENYVVSIAGSTFGARSRDPQTVPSSIKLTPPSYPQNAGRVGATGAVYLLVKVGRNGKVEEAIAEQVNLTVAANDRMMRSLREMFSQAAIKQAKRWQFSPPSKGDEVDAKFWTVRVPVVFSMGNREPPAYGQWDSYIPGPRQDAPWEKEDEGVAFSPDALPGFGIYGTKSALRMISGTQG